MPQYLIVQTTVASQDAAKSIASALVERRLAACVQISGPITSVYRWEGKIETNQEWICAAKTTVDQYEALEEAIRELHSYEEPEIIATKIVAGSKSYLDWLEAETRAADK